MNKSTKTPDWGKTLGKFEKLDLQLNFGLKEITKSFEKLSNNLPDWSKTLGEFKKIDLQLNFGLQEIAKGFANLLKSPIRNDQEDLQTIAENGWFISFWHTSIAEIPHLAQLFKKQQHADAEKRLANHFRSLLSQIETGLVEDYSARSTLISNAFQAHKNKLYDLSVPIFLIQAEGIIRDKFEASVYSKAPEHQKKIQKALDHVGNGGFGSTFFTSLVSPLPLSASTNSPSFKKTDLNRHAILHGLDSEYGNEINSLKAISWIHYVHSFCDVINDTDEDVSSDN